MKLFGPMNFGSAIVAGAIWIFYSLSVLQHFYDSAVKVPQTMSTPREVSELRLPRIYFCPADRGRSEGFKWYSFECTLSFKEEHRPCLAWKQSYEGRTPEYFEGTPVSPLDGASANAGECLEFGTHMIGVRAEWSAAWNEITLRAAFVPPSVDGYGNALQEVEVGYMPVEWKIGREETTMDRYYYPLLRVPFFFTSDDTTAGSHQNSAVATRFFVMKEMDRSLRSGGKYWYAYGGMQVPVVNVSVPNRVVEERSFFPAESMRHLAVVHAVITLQDFDEYDRQVVSPFFPFLAALGQIAGVGALLIMAIVLQQYRTIAAMDDDADEDGKAVVTTTQGGAQYSRVSAPDDDDGSSEEGQALLGVNAKRDTVATDVSTSHQPLLKTEEGLDGL